MQIEHIRIRNFRAFKEVELAAIPPLAILVGANGTGKSTLFAIFGFLRDAMNTNVRTALGPLPLAPDRVRQAMDPTALIAGRKGFGGPHQARRQPGLPGSAEPGHGRPIEIEIKYRRKPRESLVTYGLWIDEENGRPYVARELLRYHRFQHGRPWHFLDFRRGRRCWPT